METIGASKGRMIGADGVTTDVDGRKGQDVCLRERVLLPSGGSQKQRNVVKNVVVMIEQYPMSYRPVVV
jgi:hypothetical protein